MNLTFTNTSDNNTVGYEFHAQIADDNEESGDEDTYSFDDSRGGHGELDPNESMTWSVTEVPSKLFVKGSEEMIAVTIDGQQLLPGGTNDPEWTIADEWWEESTGDTGGDEQVPPGTPLVQSSLDTMDDVNGFFVETQTNRGKVDTVSSNPTPAEGAGAMRINQPSKQRSNEAYGGNEFYGTEGFHYLDERSEYPDDGLEECHISFYAMLDEGYTIDNPWAGFQAGKGFPGFDGRWEKGAQSTREAWLINGAIWSAGEIGKNVDDWLLSFYLYDRKTNIGSSGRSYHPSMAMEKGRWYKIDRYVDVKRDVAKQWIDGNLAIDLDSSNIDLNDGSAPHDKLYAIRNLFYYGGGWGAPDGSGDNFAYIDDIRVFGNSQ